MALKYSNYDVDCFCISLDKLYCLCIGLSLSYLFPLSCGSYFCRILVLMENWWSTTLAPWRGAKP